MGEFEKFSREIGRRLDLVQGAGGNTSLKFGDVMRIKASGAWLADALQKPIFVDVDLAPLRAAMAGEFDDDDLKTALGSRDAGDLRPSIETPLHALSPFKAVAHVHSANAIAWSVRKDAAKQLAANLEGIEWSFVQYKRPGAPLAVAVRDAFATARPSVLILGNHGLVVGAESIAELRALLEEVERRLAVEPATTKRDVALPPPPSEYQWVGDSPAAFLAFDEARLAAAAKGSLYPDHVVFLGPALVAGDVGEIARMAPPPKVAVVAGVGVLARSDLTPGARAMLDCLGLVMARVDPGAPINYLSADDEQALLGWDAETYRQARDKQSAAAARL